MPTIPLLAVYHASTRKCPLSDLAGISEIVDAAGLLDVPQTRIGSGGNDGTGEQGTAFRPIERRAASRPDAVPGQPPIPLLPGTNPPVAVRPAPKAKSFHGTAEVTASTAKMRLVQVAEEVISLLCSDPNATVHVTVEIHADFPAGVSDQIKRAVSENATSLGFKAKDWE